MLFSSVYFIFTFLPVVVILYYALPEQAKNPILLIASLFFYSWGEPLYVVLMIFSCILNYSMAKEVKDNKFNLYFTIAMNLFILGFFKYYGFLMETINGLLNVNIEYSSLPLPIGISFYTFQGLSYVVDVYRGDVKPQKSLIKFSLFLSLFPQLIAGPIIKYRDIENQLSYRKINIVTLGYGISRFIFGLSKKVLLANTFGLIYTTIGEMPANEITVLGSWFSMITFSLQIYFDFSGYSDMAIGLGRIFGFTFKENFCYPYMSKSITEFWRKWHISLSTWFKEYLYIPLGGNQVSKKRHIINLLIVWFATGLWHGASWNFIAWGLYYAILLIIEKYIIKDYLTKIPNWLQHVYALLFIGIGWVLFSSNTLTEALIQLSHLIGIGTNGFINNEAFYLFKSNFVLLLFGIACSGPYAYRKFRKFMPDHIITSIIITIGMFIVSISYLVYSSYNPFLYFRF